MFLGGAGLGEIDFSAAGWRERPEVAASQGADLHGNRKEGLQTDFFSMHRLTRRNWRELPCFPPRPRTLLLGSRFRLSRAPCSSDVSRGDRFFDRAEEVGDFEGLAQHLAGGTAVGGDVFHVGRRTNQ